jgi:hypothetical protein
MRVIATMQPIVQQASFFRDRSLTTLTIGEASLRMKLLCAIQATTFVGLLPVPHPILIRKYQKNPQTNVSFSTYLYA